MTQAHVSEKKKEAVINVKKQIGEYSVVGILDMHKLPGKQLFEIRNKLRGEAKIHMVKKKLIKLALEAASQKNVKELIDKLQGEPALLFSNTDPFKLARIIDKSKSPASAKPGDIAPKDIIVKEGPTQLAAGPVIGELQRVKIPATVAGEKITIKKDTVVVKAGEEIKKNVADIITKLGIEPMEIGLTLVAVWNDGTIYDKDVLFISQEKYLQDILTAYSNAYNLTMELGYPTKYNLPMMIAKAHSQAKSLALETGTITKDTIGSLLTKGKAHASEIGKKADIENLKPAEGKPVEEKKEVKSTEEKTEEKKKKSTEKSKPEVKEIQQEKKKEKQDEKTENIDDKNSQEKKE